VSGIGKWIRNDLRKMNSPGDVVRTVRSYPMILVRALLSFLFALFVIWGVLALFGHADLIASWWWPAAIWASTSAGAMISDRKTNAARRSSQPK